MFISLIIFVRNKEFVFNLAVKFSKNAVFVTGFATISTDDKFVFTCASFLDLIFSIAANAGKI